MANDATLRIGADTRDAERALGSLQTALKGLATGAVVAGFIKLADQATELRNRLNQVSTSVDHTNVLFNSLVQISNNARTPLTTTGDLFFRIARSADQLGISQNQALQATENIAKAIASSGISAQEAAGPLLQLGQALQSGTLQGDELRSILEGLPPVAKALADSLGVPIGALRRLGSEGKLSSQQVITAILAARDSIERDFAKTTPTIGQAFTVLQNNLTAFVTALDRALGASSQGASAILTLANAIKSLTDNISVVVEGMKILGQIALTVFLFTFAGRIAAAIRVVAGYIQSAGFIFVDLGTKIGALTGGFMTFVRVASQQVKSVITQITGGGQALSSTFGVLSKVLDFVTRAVFIPLNGVLRILASAFQNLIGIISVAIGAALGFLDPIISRVRRLLEYIGLLEKKPVQLPPAANPAGDQATQEAMAKRNAALAMATKEQENFNKEVEKSIRAGKLETEIKLMSLTMTQAEVQEFRARQELINKAADAGVKVTQQQLETVGLLARQNAAIDAQIELQKKLNEMREAARTALETVRTQDPEYAAKIKQIDALLDLEIAYQEGLLQSQTEYLALRKQIEDQYILDKYAAEQAQIERIDQLREIALSKELQRIGMTRKAADEAAKSQVEFSKRTEMQKAQFAIEQGASVFESLGKYNRQAFEAAKAFNIANAIMNTYTGATKALAMYPPPFNFIAAAAVVAGGMAQIAQIRAQQYSGRALGGPVMAGESYIVGERGPELFTPATSGGITPNNQLSDMAAPVNINFNIQANDARGFDQLLAERKPMIINMVRTAMNDRGNKANL